jgi:hypothetical protein
LVATGHVSTRAGKSPARSCAGSSAGLLAGPKRHPGWPRPRRAGRFGASGIEGAVGARFAARTRWRPPCRRRRPSWVTVDRNSRPANGPSGRRSHERIAPPRSGNATANIAPNAAIRRREVEESPTTSSRATLRHGQLRSAHTVCASRAFRSRPWRVAWASGTIDFASTTRTEPVARWSARMSIDPRSPQTENDASTATSQPLAASMATHVSTIPACASSRSRSSASPRQRSRTSTVAPTAAAMLRSEATETESMSPLSTFVTRERDVPAVRPTSSWRRRR